MILVLLAACGGSAEVRPLLPEPAVPIDAPVPAVEPAPVGPEPLPTSGTFVRELVPGLVVAAYDLPPIDGSYNRPDPAALVGIDPRIFVVTLDPARFDIVYVSALDPAVPGGVRGADRWASEHDLVVAWNPGMFEPNGKATGYTRTGAFTSQPQVRRNALYASYFVADPGSVGVVHQVPPKASGTYVELASLPASQIAALDAHGLVAQSLTILHDGHGVYPPRQNHWSELAFGTDREGRAAVVFTRWPMEMRELGARIEALDLGLTELIHGEGGPEASLVVRAGGVSLDLCGSYETDFYDDSNTHLWALPAVMGARPRSL